MSLGVVCSGLGDSTSHLHRSLLLLLLAHVRLSCLYRRCGRRRRRPQLRLRRRRHLKATPSRSRSIVRTNVKYAKCLGQRLPSSLLFKLQAPWLYSSALCARFSLYFSRATTCRLKRLPIALTCNTALLDTRYPSNGRTAPGELIGWYSRADSFRRRSGCVVFFSPSSARVSKRSVNGSRICSICAELKLDAKVENTVKDAQKRRKKKRRQRKSQWYRSGRTTSRRRNRRRNRHKQQPTLSARSQKSR